MVLNKCYLVVKERQKCDDEASFLAGKIYFDVTKTSVKNSTNIKF